MFDGIGIVVMREGDAGVGIIIVYRYRYAGEKERERNTMMAALIIEEEHFSKLHVRVNQFSSVFQRCVFV